MASVNLLYYVSHYYEYKEKPDVGWIVLLAYCLDNTAIVAPTLLSDMAPRENTTLRLCILS